MAVGRSLLKLLTLVPWGVPGVPGGPSLSATGDIGLALPLGTPLHTLHFLNRNMLCLLHQQQLLVLAQIVQTTYIFAAQCMHESSNSTNGGKLHTWFHSLPQRIFVKQMPEAWSLVAKLVLYLGFVTRSTCAQLNYRIWKRIRG
jgi:hypothetical protein